MAIFKMADVSHVAFHLGSGGPPTSSNFGPTGCMVSLFGDTAIFRFRQVGLKMPIHTPFGWVLGAHFRQVMSLIILSPKEPSLG